MTRPTTAVSTFCDRRSPSERTINTLQIEETIRKLGLIDQGQHVFLQEAPGQRNSRVYFASIDNGPPALTVRLSNQPDHFASEARALDDAAGCPGVPRLRASTGRLLIHDYVPGEPGALTGRSDLEIASLAACLACIHGKIYQSFTPWPARLQQTGTRLDLLRHRIESLKHYDSYEMAVNGGISAGLAGIIKRVARLRPIEPDWLVSSFSRLHGDLSIGNILWSDQSARLIDWEYSRVGDPAEDLAYVLTEQRIGPVAFEPLVAAYRAAGGQREVWRRVPVYAVFTAVDAALWWLDYGQREQATTDLQVRRRVETGWEWLAHATQ